MDSPTYDAQTKKYKFKESFLVKGRRVKVIGMCDSDPEYHPIRIMIHKNRIPKITFLMHRVCFKEDDGRKNRVDAVLLT